MLLYDWLLSLCLSAKWDPVVECLGLGHAQGWTLAHHPSPHSRHQDDAWSSSISRTSHARHVHEHGTPTHDPSRNHTLREKTFRFCTTCLHFRFTSQTMFILSRFVSVEIYFFLASSHRGKSHCWQIIFVNKMNPSFQLTSVFVFYLQVEENSTEDKSKDGAPLDSQSEATNYFLQYIATPRWWSILLFWPVLAFLLHSQFPSTNSSYLFFLFFYFILLLLFQFKKCRKQCSRRSKICFWAEHVWKSFGKWKKKKNTKPEAC